MQERKTRNTKEGDREESDGKRLRVRGWRQEPEQSGRDWERFSEGDLWRGRRGGGGGKEEEELAGRRPGAQSTLGEEGWWAERLSS